MLPDEHLIMTDEAYVEQLLKETALLVKNIAAIRSTTKTVDADQLTEQNNTITRLRSPY